jgi:hypothetical protein
VSDSFLGENQRLLLLEFPSGDLDAGVPCETLSKKWLSPIETMV